jgi:hypothetical protein
LGTVKRFIERFQKTTTQFLLLLFGLPLFIFLVLALAQWGSGSSCGWQFPKWFGCILHDHDSLAAGLIGAAGALFAAWIAWTAVQRQLEEQQRQARIVERAYISGGGARKFNVIEKGQGSGEYIYIPSRSFEFHVSNYGKTPGRVFKLGWGFCEETDIPAGEPSYQTKYFDSWIDPGRSGLPLLEITIPDNLARPTIYGRVFYTTVFGDHFSSGFLYRLPDVPRDSESITPPHPSYTDDRKEH